MTDAILSALERSGAGPLGPQERDRRLNGGDRQKRQSQAPGTVDAVLVVTFDGLEQDQPAPAQLSADKQAQHSYRAGNSSRKTRQIMANIHHRLVVGPLPHVKGDAQNKRPKGCWGWGVWSRQFKQIFIC